MSRRVNVLEKEISSSRRPFPHLRPPLLSLLHSFLCSANNRRYPGSGLFAIPRLLCFVGSYFIRRLLTPSVACWFVQRPTRPKWSNRVDPVRY
ncbi:Hypothetical protein NTJ_09657 [Nesidiocoris tenuis]|uniref:Uncharacterized protein n=1 Tax=Nesidiocoris tenuis TaxID=355587 RepID=A0ABN7AXW1_9HEMI|nr:Hypothetical protein NTJ_09657 [Nesidiocoris tenuis]